METAKGILILSGQLEILSHDDFDMRSWLNVTDNFLKSIFGENTNKSKQLYSICNTIKAQFVGITDEDIVQFKSQWKDLLLGYIKELEIIGVPSQPIKTPHNSVNVVLNQSQSQQQTQKVSIEINFIIEAIKEDLTGKQFQEIESIIKDPNIDNKKQKLTDLLLSFGSNVASGILGNILSNPQIFM